MASKKYSIFLNFETQLGTVSGSDGYVLHNESKVRDVAEIISLK